MKNMNGVSDGGVSVYETRNARTTRTVSNHHETAIYSSLPNRHHMNGNHQNGVMSLQHREVNGNLTSPGWQGSTEKFEVPLPFGYHMDLDFLRFCDDESVSAETLERLKELRKARRKQRKTLEALMGIRQEQKEREKRALELVPQKRYITTGIRKISPPVNKPPPDVVNTPEFLRDAIKDAVQDFEQCLERSKEENKLGLQTFDLLNLSGNTMTASTPVSTKCSKFNTFPRALSSPEESSQHHQTSTFKLYRQSSNSSISSVSTNSSALPYLTSDALATLPSSVPHLGMTANEAMETESIASITSEMSTHTLRNIREQMARSLSKLKEYEKQVETIPVMQVKLSVLKEEKRLLMLKLKQRELQLRRDRGETEPESDGMALDYDTEEEDLDEKVDRMSLGIRRRFQEMNSRARSESPYARGGFINPEEFISVRKKRSASCGYNSDSDMYHMNHLSEKRYFDGQEQRLRINKSSGHHNLSSPHIEHRSEVNFYPNASRKPVKNAVHSPPRKHKDVRDSAVNTDPMPRPKTPEPLVIVEKVEVERSPPPPVRKRDRAINTDPPPKSPPPPRKVSHSTNTTAPRTMGRSTGTLLSMDKLVTMDEMEARIQEAVFKTEEEIMGCPLLQKAMAKVEEEAIHGPRVSTIYEKDEVETADVECQVGDENLRPFVINVGLQCKMDEQQPMLFECKNCMGDPDNVERRSRSIDPAAEKLVRTIGVGECKIIEDPVGPVKFREIGVCTEKWVEVMKASKQTDTEDFAFKDTESPRVADMVFEPSPERIVLERRSSLRRTSAGSPSFSRKSSVNSPVPSRKSSSTPTKVITRSQGTMTTAEVKLKVPTRDAKTGSLSVPTKSVATSAMTLPLASKNLPAPGSPLSTPESEKPPVKLCDKCNKDIQKVAAGMMNVPSPSPSPRLAPPSPDMPWLSKIPRPIPENPDVSKLKSASSIGNLSIDSRPRTPTMQRSKSSLIPSMGRRVSSPKSPIPMTGRRDVGTPPPHPATPPVGSRRAPSPLARSQSPYSQEKRSLIPKLSPSTSRKQPPSPVNTSAANKLTSGSGNRTASPSMIPRVVTPPALRKMYPKTSDKLATPDRNVVRKNTFTKLSVGVANPDLEKSRSSSLERIKEEEPKKKVINDETDSSGDEKETKKSGVSATGFPLPGAALFTPINANRIKVEPSKEMKAALKVLNDSLGRTTRGNAQVTNAVNIIQQEWFKTSSTKQSNPLDVEDYLDSIEDISKELLHRVVNLTDVNGNTALHYSVSHGNFDVVSILLDSKVANPNIMNKAGYTCTMLISLAQIQNDTHRSVVSRLFGISDVNVRATQHGQTALMLAVSHGRADMVQLLVESGAGINIRDEDGSTALMCAAEHGHMEIVKFLLQQADIDVLAKDNDGLTALAVAMEAGHRDVGVVLYAGMTFSRGSSPFSSMRIKGSGSRTSTPTARSPMRSPIPTGKRTPVTSKSPARPGPTPPLRTRRNSSNQ